MSTKNLGDFALLVSFRKDGLGGVFGAVLYREFGWHRLIRCECYDLRRVKVGLPRSIRIALRDRYRDFPFWQITDLKLSLEDKFQRELNLPFG